MRSAAAIAAWHAVWTPTRTLAHELYVVALGESDVNTAAFRYMLARIASAAPFVMRS